MTSQPWLPLQAYSSKYDVSLSTLRRKIKGQSIPYKLENGKYFILDEAPESEKPRLEKSRSRGPSHGHGDALAHNAASAFVQPSQHYAPMAPSLPATPQPEMPARAFVEASVLSSANRLVEELKSAYAKILQEKEEQITLLKDEVGDLRMLVKIMEQNQSLRANSGSQSESDLDSNSESDADSDSSQQESHSAVRQEYQSEGARSHQPNESASHSLELETPRNQTPLEFSFSQFQNLDLDEF